MVRNSHSHIDMLSVEEAFDRIIQCFNVLDYEEKNILDALGQVLAEDVYSPMDIPSMTNSAMDGYAVRYIDTDGANQQHPNLLKVIDTIAAGQIPQTAISPHTAIRIMTGAPIPSGADAVVPFENTDEKERLDTKTDLTNIGICSKIDCGENIRPSGEDIKQGELALAKGTTFRPYEIGVLASIGVNTVKVIRRPRIALLATGDELITPDQPGTPGKIFDSNSHVGIMFLLVLEEYSIFSHDSFCIVKVFSSSFIWSSFGRSILSVNR